MLALTAFSLAGQGQGHIQRPSWGSQGKQNCNENGKNVLFRGLNLRSSVTYPSEDVIHSEIRKNSDALAGLPPPLTTERRISGDVDMDPCKAGEVPIAGVATRLGTWKL